MTLVCIGETARLILRNWRESDREPFARLNADLKPSAADRNDQDVKSSGPISRGLVPEAARAPIALPIHPADLSDLLIRRDILARVRRKPRGCNRSTAHTDDLASGRRSGRSSTPRTITATRMGGGFLESVVAREAADALKRCSGSVPYRYRNHDRQRDF